MTHVQLRELPRNPAHEKALALSEVHRGLEFVLVRNGIPSARAAIFHKDADEVRQDKDGYLPIMASIKDPSTGEDRPALVYPVDDGLICDGQGNWVETSFIVRAEDATQL